MSCSKKKVRRTIFSLIPGVKPKRYKHFRVIFIRISEVKNRLTIEFKENLLKKVKQKIDGHTKHGVDSYNNHKDYFHKTYEISFDNINDDLYQDILGWLTWKHDSKSVEAFFNKRS